MNICRPPCPDVYAAGDNAFFPYTVLGKQMRVEHWDNALNQGKQAGRNMAGARERYTTCLISSRTSSSSDTRRWAT